MSTQRREIRWRPTRSTRRLGALEQVGSAPIAAHGTVTACGGTAPPALPAWFHPSDEDPSPGALELATNSLPLDDRWFYSVQPVRFLRGSPPLWVGSRQVAAVPALAGSSLPPIPLSSCHALPHPALPQFPAANRRRTERYDGKRDLHLQHAA